MKKKLLWAAFVSYCVLMLWLLFGQRAGAVQYGNYWQQLQANINLVPLATVWEFLRGLLGFGESSLRVHALINLAGNVVMFVPLGVLPVLLFPRLRRFWRLLLMALAVILWVEAVQLFSLLGTFDVDDVLLNLVGAAIGYALTKIKEI